MEQAHGREAAEWNGIDWRKPRPPCLHWLGTLCCWGSVPLTRRQFELSDALVGVCAGSEPRARVPEPNPRAVVAVHSSEIIPKQTAEHRHRGCPLPGSPQGPRAASLQTPPALGGPGSSLWVEPGGVAVQSGLLNERVLLKRPMFITCNKATASNPSCTGNCCCWHGQHGAVRALGWEFCDPRGEQAEQPAQSAQLLHKHGPFPHTMGNALGRQCPQWDCLAVGSSALLCVQKLVAQGAHSLIAIHKGLP